MGANPRIVTEDVLFQWDGVSTRLGRGQVLDVTPGSALEAAIGAQRLRPLGAVAAQPPAEEPAPQEAGAKDDGKAPEEPAAAARKTKSAAKTADSDEQDGES